VRRSVRVKGRLGNQLERTMPAGTDWKGAYHTGSRTKRDGLKNQA
jgi:hypothetical protein